LSFVHTFGKNNSMGWLKKRKPLLYSTQSSLKISQRTFLTGTVNLTSH
jgi:hypothetical protein